MLNRRNASRIVLAGLALIIISSIAFASPWTVALDWLGLGQPAAETTAQPSAPVLAPETVVLNDDFEAATTFVLANSAGSVNDWFIGTATNNGGTKSAYITNNGGAANAYTNTDDETATHIYAPITIPAGETAIVLSFDWKGVGEHSTDNNSGNGTSWDFMRVSLTAAPPVGGTMTATADQLPVIFNAQANYNRAYVVLPASAAGTTKNLVFTWRDDTSGGSTAPAIDNVTVTSQAPAALSGPKAIPGDYPTIGAAIAAVNANGADTSAGNLTFNVTPGLTVNETPAVLTATGSATGRIIFQKSAAGTNPKIIATGTNNSGGIGSGTVTTSTDGIIIIQGGDFITFDGIDLEGGALVGTTTTTTAQEYGYLLRNASATNGAQNNIIQNTSVTLNRINTVGVGIQASATTTAGGFTPTSAAGANSGNKYYNLTIQNVHSGVYLLGTAAFPDDLSEVGVTGAVTKNLIGAATANDIGNSTSTTWGIRVASQSNAKVFNNEIRNINNITGSTATVTGIHMDNSGAVTAVSLGTTQIYNNQIHDLNNAGTSAGIVYGIRANLTGNAGSIARIQNNFIYALNSSSTSTTSVRLFGLQVQDAGVGTGAMFNVHNNSIRLAPTSIATINTCFAIGVVTGPVYNVQNNIFANFTGAQAGTAKHYTWVSTSNGSIGVAGTISDWNNLYVSNTTNGFVGRGSTADFADLTAWRAMQAGAGPDDNSISADPSFVSATDLHLTGASTSINAGTTIATVTDDIDGQSRPQAAVYDIGADEFVPTPGTLQLSSTTYSGSEGGTANATVNRVSGSSGIVGVTYTLADVSAVGGAACGAGVDYVNPGPQLLSFGDTVTSQPIMVTLCSDAVLDPGETFTITLSLPTGGASLGSPTVATVTITDIAPPFNGSYNVGAAQPYTSLTNVGGIFEAINGSGVSGNVTINITSDLTGETGTVALNEVASPNTILIKPSGAPRTITGSNAANAIIRINGADNVTVDGSTTASFAEDASPEVVGGNAALRELTVINTNVALNASGIAIHSGPNGAQNNKIQNLNVRGIDPATSFIGIAIGGATPGSLGTDNDGNRVENCSIQKFFYGIYAAGASSANKDFGTAITRNDMTGTGTNRILEGGILVGNQDTINIFENSIGGISSTLNGFDTFGIGLGAGSADAQISTTATTNGGVTGASVLHNKINGVTNAASSGYGSAGIAVAGDTGSANTISNNMITGVVANATSPDISVGIFVAGVTGSTTRLFSNSVSMTGDRGPTGSQIGSYGVAITGADPAVEVKNNIFYTTQVATGGGATAKSYAIGVVGTTFVNLDSNFNDFWSTGANDGGFRSGGLGATATDYAALSGAGSWNAATGKDANSIEADPLYVNPLNDLHLLGSPVLSPAAGAGVAGIGETTDIDLDPRPASNPDMGADELVQAVLGTIPAGTYYNVAAANNNLIGGNTTVTNTLYLNGLLSGNLNTLTLGCNGSVITPGDNAYFVLGDFKKEFCGTGTFTFPVGTVPDNMRAEGASPEGNPSEYTPMDATITAGTFPGGAPPSLTVSVTDDFLTGVVQTDAISRYWTVEESGDLTANMTFHYRDAPLDANGDESLYKVFKRSGGFTTEVTPNSNNPAGNTVSVTGVSSFSQWGAAAAVPTAASVSVSGRVTTASGNGIRNAFVTISGNSLPQALRVQTGSLGWYQFDNLQAGETYIIQVGAKRFRFAVPSRVITVQDSLTDIDFIANPQE